MSAPVLAKNQRHIVDSSPTDVSGENGPMERGRLDGRGENGEIGGPMHLFSMSKQMPRYGHNINPAKMTHGINKHNAIRWAIRPACLGNHGGAAKDQSPPRHPVANKAPKNSAIPTRMSQPPQDGDEGLLLAAG
jgi:hypothetical protein